MTKVSFKIACNSGKRFRENAEQDWLSIDENGYMKEEGDSYCNIHINVDHINASYELEEEEKKITITESEFNKSWNDYVKPLVNYHRREHLKSMKDSLGF